MDKIEDDVNQIGKDLDDIQCNPIIKFFQSCLKCIQDSISYFLKR